MIKKVKKAAVKKFKTVKEPRKVWLLAVTGYGKWLYHGTKKQAEQRALDKAEWEGERAMPVVDVTDAVDSCTRNMVYKLVDWLRRNPRLAGEKAAQKLMRDFCNEETTLEDIETFCLEKHNIAGAA